MIKLITLLGLALAPLLLLHPAQAQAAVEQGDSTDILSVDQPAGANQEGNGDTSNKKKKKKKKMKKNPAPHDE